MVIDPMRIRFCVEKALYLSQSGRKGPTWLDIPLDIQGAYVETDALIGFDPADYEAGGTGWAEKSPAEIPEDTAGKGEKRQILPPKVTEDVARQVIEKIRESKRPVFNVGSGIRLAGAHDVFLRVADKLGIPLVTGWNSTDAVWDEHPLYVGRAGGFGDRPGNFAVQNSDLVFSVGSRLSIRQVGYNYETWARAAYVIVNDIDPEELKKPSVHADMRIHADAKDLLEVMDRVLDEEKSLPVFKGGEGKNGMTWQENCQLWKKKYPVVLPRHYEGGEGQEANVYAFIKELSRRLPEGRITVVGNGSACVVGGHAYVIKKGQRFITNSAIASMGYDLPAAIGACVAADREELIMVSGDGSMQMNLQELQTIIHHRLPIKLFIINNGGYHSIRQTQKNFFGEPLVGVGVDSHDLSFPSMEKLAWAYGYPYTAIHNNVEMGQVLDETLAMDGPVICEIFVTVDQPFEPKSASKRLADGSIVSAPLEDLAPFLPDEEMDEIMIIPRIKG